MRYRARFKAGFAEESFCYFCYPLKTKNAVLYEVNMTGHEKITDRYSMEREGYYNYLLNFTLSGRGRMIYRNREYDLKAGDLLFIDCAEKHAFTSAEGGGWEFVYVHVNGLGLKYLYDAFTMKTGNIFYGYNGKAFLSGISQLHALLDKLPKEKYENSFHIHLDDAACCDTAQIVYELITDVARKISGVSSEKPYAITLALEYIRKNFFRDLTLDEIAQAAYLSKYHFERLFTEHMGVTVHAYVTELRFQRAMWLLETTNMPVADVAAEVGYSDGQALVKLFKKNFGITPNAYRKEKYHYRETRSTLPPS